MLTMIHSNPARVSDGILRIDRKFHTGMLRYAAEIDAPLVTAHQSASQEPMDMIEVPLAELPYRVFIIDQPQSNGRSLAQEIALSELIYADDLSFGAAALARRQNIPYVLLLEYDLPTSLRFDTGQVSSPLRKLSRAAKRIVRHFGPAARARRDAAAIHCNGFPIFDETAGYQADRLLYFDSRMSQDAVIEEGALQERLAARTGRLSLLYSGRYEKEKGALDVVRAAIACLERGLDVELHCYGQGAQGDDMQRLAASFAHRITVHKPVPYPQLVEISRSFDVFVCCHVQSDPSCTYLESFGAGLPIVGYANRMWTRLQSASGAGIVARLGSPESIAAGIAAMSRDPRQLAEMSGRARAFALQHAFEREFEKRTSHLNAVLSRLRGLKGTSSAAGRGAPTSAAPA